MIRLDSERLLYREMDEHDFDAVAGILRDPEVRRIWEQEFPMRRSAPGSSARQRGYRQNGIDYLLAVEKATGEPIGQVGVLREEIDGQTVWGVGYILRGDCRGKGYATEGARRMAAYAFDELGADRIL